MASLQEKLNEAWKNALRSRDALRRDTLAGLRAAVKNAEISSRTAGVESAALDDAATLAVLEREAKKRREAIEEYTRLDRPDRADAERAELAIIEEFLPAQMSDGELETLVREVLNETGASKLSDVGRVMQAVLPRVAGRADGRRVNALVRRLLAD
jgi:uncharacterized protein